MNFRILGKKKIYNSKFVKGQKNLKRKLSLCSTIELRISYLIFFAWVILSTNYLVSIGSKMTFVFSDFWNYFVVICPVS